MTFPATIFIPYAPYHASLVTRAYQSALAQTIECEVVLGLSVGTPAKLRNQALQASTDFVVFLDADDVLNPLFVEHCLQAYDEQHYVYTAWSEGDAAFKPKLCPWEVDSHHIVTTLYPTALFKELGGFDETLPGHEDADFYMRSYSKGVCGIFLDEVLVHRPDKSSRRSEAFHARADYFDIMQQIPLKYGGLDKIMACCGQPNVQAQTDPGAMQAGDVLVETLWAGMHSEYSPYSERLYVGGNHNQIWVAAIDVEKFPNWFKPVQNMAELFPSKERALKESGLI
jgi:hypothetical protein